MEIAWDYRAEASWWDGDATAASTGVAVNGLAFAPGTKNMPGETDPPALMPEQPAPNTPSIIGIASHKKFQFNLTCPV